MAADGDTVVAVGGDGLVGCLAGALMNTDGALGIVPAGRGNDFARALDIPRDPVQATRLVVQGEERLLDVGAVDGKPFVGIASVGFDSDANRIANETKLVKGNWWRSAILLLTLYAIAIAAGPIVGFVVLFTTPLDPQLLDLVGSAVYVIVFPFVAIAATLLFFDLKKRREEATKSVEGVAISPAGPG